MNWLDALIALLVAGAALTGYRAGFASRVLSWLGLTIGLVLGVLYVDDIANALRRSTPQTRLIASLAFLFLAAVLAQAVGVAVGSMLRRHIATGGALGAADRGAGALVGAFTVLVAVWMLVPALASTPGWPARAARGSTIARAVDRVAPVPPDSLAALSRLLDAAPFPGVFELHERPQDVGPPPGSGLPARVATRVARSVVKVEGRPCDLIQQGSGFVAADGLVLTNAHVVAGEPSTTVLTPDGRRLDAAVVDFDPERDVAALRVARLDLDPLPRAHGQVGGSGAVIGYPGGGVQQQSPARIADQVVARSGTNIYRTGPATREIFVLAAHLERGDSGGPLLDRRGNVVGLAFAVDQADPDTTAYALTRAEVERALDRAAGRASAVSTGPCLVG